MASGIRLSIASLGLGLGLGLALALWPAAAVAQPAGNLPIDTFRPAIDSRGYLTINASQPLGHGELSFGLGALSWGHGLLDFESDPAFYRVNDVVTATLGAALGLRLGPLELELGAALPLTILAGDRGPDDIGDPGNANDDKNYKLDGQGVGNIGLHLKTRILRTVRPPHTGVSLIASVFLPTASPADAFLGDKKAVPQLVGVIDQELVGGRLRLAVNGGIRIRSRTSFTDTGDMGAPATNRTIAATAELPLGFGVAWGLAPGRFDLVGEVFGAVPLGDSDNYLPLEALAGVKLYLAKNSFLSLGAGRGLVPSKGGSPDARAFIGIVFEPNIGDRDGDGIKDDVDQCVNEPEDRDRFEDEDGCPDPDNDKDKILDEDDRCRNIPEDYDGVQDEDGCPEGNANDRDNDGLLDHLDKCPDDPEDFDGFEDEDGCPDTDNDRDGIIDADDLCPLAPEDRDRFEDEDGCPDADNDRDRIADKDDRCPNEPETYNNVDDKDGCPDKGVVVETEGVLEILKPIGFEYNSDVIKRDSYYILDAVVAAMQGNLDIELIEIAGHTDEQGNDAYNLDLSNRRAASVLRYLTGKGVEAKRLESQGYGETRPVDPGHNAAAYVKNRRVEFVILKRRTGVGGPTRTRP
ncbi:MAG TPA: OmpA family protein [Kofleriaceae bacterium]|nr:OmpA family protein [Kofleriaceae bacterium]